MRLGDLDALKKAIEELEITEELVDYDCDDVSTTGVSQYLDRPDVLDLIDNAPTVKFSLLPADESKNEAYMRGYNHGKVEGILQAETRPKGEWVVEKNQFGDILHCSICGARPRRSEYGYDLHDKFCNECGADMRGGKE